MSLTQIERLTTQFYDWERRGRGWYLFETPIHLEPAYVPFFFHDKLSTGYVDDGKRPTWVSRISDFLRGSAKQTSQPNPFALDYSTVDAYEYPIDETLSAFTIVLPKEGNISLPESEHFLLMLSNCKYVISFEIIGTVDSISIQFLCSSSDAAYLFHQIKAYFPVVSIQEDPAGFDRILLQDGEDTSIIDFGLQDEFMRPLLLAKNFDIDSFISISGVLENIKKNEQGGVQILFQPAIYPWSESILRSVMDNNGDPFFLDAPEMVKLAQEKVSSPLFAVTMRVFGQSQTLERSQRIALDLANTLIQTTRSPFNTLIPLYTAAYSFKERLADVYLRRSRRIGMLLNSRELVNLVHLPSARIGSKKLVREIKKTKEAPSITEGHPFVLGINEHQGIAKEISESIQQRLKHTHIIGATGTGKSTLLLHLIAQDISHGNGCAVLDPHGDLIEAVLKTIPPERIDDVIVIDPADADYPIGFNILSAHSEIEKEILSSDLIASFRRLSTSWGDQMNSVFANAILAFVESEKIGTLMDLRRFLVEANYRNHYLKSVTDHNIIYYWQKEFPLLKSNSIGSILTRLDTFLRPKLVRNMVAQKKSLDFEEILNSKKILLVKLAQGLIGSENSYLLGTLIVSKIHQAAMARQVLSQAERSPFFLYIDEFQHFITPSMEGILSGARKYGLGLILAHQDMQQLVKNDSELASSVISNAGTRICFRLGDIDAKKFESGFSDFEASDLMSLNTGEAIVRIEQPENDFNLQVLPLQEAATYYTSLIIDSSRIRYGSSKADVEAALKELYGSGESFPTQKIAKEEKIIREEHKPIEEVAQKGPVVEDLIPETQKKEESQHRYLQTLIKKMAESRGFKALIEEPLQDKSGRVDVFLEGHGKRIACEVTVTTTKEWEMHNIEKCLRNGFDYVFECSTDPKVIEQLQRLIEKQDISDADRQKIFIVTPDEVFSLLDMLIEKGRTSETKIKGYRVKVEYDAVSHDTMNKKRESISKVVINSLKRLKK